MPRSGQEKKDWVALRMNSVSAGAELSLCGFVVAFVTTVSSKDIIVVFQVKSRTPFDESAFQQQKEELRSRMLQTIRDKHFEDYIHKATDDLQKAGKIQIIFKAIESALQDRSAK